MLERARALRYRWRYARLRRTQSARLQGDIVENQSSDFKTGYVRLISLLRRKNRNHGVLSKLQHWFYPNFVMLPRQNYFEAVMHLVAGRNPLRPLSEYQNELLEDLLLRESFRRASDARLIGGEFAEHVGMRKVGNLVTYYGLMRELKPSIVVETGTATGESASLILAALHRNMSGRLISINLPAVAGKLTMEVTLKPTEIGCLIPEAYRSRWEYIRGDAKECLPKVLLENRADVFIHDSLHTRTHMLYELNVARALLPEGGIIISDDILWNKAFVTFLESHDLRGITCESNPNLAITVNRFDAYEKSIGLEVVRH
jgi:predicted O-methyltransferase YrrM